jgi:2'-5' RNA ligase
MTLRSRLATATLPAPAVPVGKGFGSGIPPQIQAAEARSQMTPTSPFSPGEPIGPYDGFSRTPRSHDYVTGYNIATRPRTHERVAFETLKGLIGAYDVAGVCIRHRIASLRSLDYKLVAMDGYEGDIAAEVAEGKRVLKRPDRKTLFKPWLAKYLRGILSYDAGTLYKMRNRGGKAVGLKVVDGTCYSDDTEVLTREGWKLFADVDISRDEFATRNQKTREFEWQAATHYTVQDWAGREPLYNFHSRSYDLLVTGNHRMLVTSTLKALGGCGRHGGESFVPAEYLAEHFTGGTAIPATSTWTGTPISEFRLPPVKRGECVTMSGVRAAREALGWTRYRAVKKTGLTYNTYDSAEAGRQVELSTAEAIRAALGGSVAWEVTGSLAKIDAIRGDDFAAFMGMWLSEGSLNGSSNYIYVCQQPGSKGYEEFRAALIRMLGSEPSYDGSKWRFKSSALAHYLRQFGHAQDKFIPAEILDASAEQLAIFWRFYMLGDGSYDGRREHIVTASRLMADGLQEVAQKIGYQASVQKRRLAAPGMIMPHGGVQISAPRQHYSVRLRTSKTYLVRHVDRVPYDRKVYCVTVPNETLYVRRNGRPAWCGNTIAPLQDYWGDPPDAPAPAYVQYVQGLPWNWLTRDDLIYEPYDPQDDSVYGRAPLEDILLSANTDLRFQLYFLQRFTEGNLPAAFADAPESWSPDQIEQFQEYWDAFMAGDQSRKHQIRWLPPGSKIAWSNEKDFDDRFSLFLMRKTCASFSVVPSDIGFTEDVNRSSGESQADVQHRVGDLPMAHHIQDILSEFLQDDLQLPLQFAFDLGEEQDDRVDQANADDTYMKMGVIGPSEIREMRYGLTDAQPIPRFIYTERAGPIPIASLLAVAGDVDPADGLPEEGTELPRTVFGGTEGVLPNPPIKVMSLAEREFGPGAMPPAPPPQPKMTDADVTPELTSAQVAKEGEGAALAGNVTAGITAETGLYSYDLDDGQYGSAGEEEREDAARNTAVLKELRAFRRFAKARHKAGEWRDFEFDAVDAGTARRLNAEGRGLVAKAGVPGLTSRSGMISLDIPEGLITPPPGGVDADGMHVTVVYLGPAVDDEAFAAACDRARQAAALVPGPLPGTVSGIGAFPPSSSSDGKVPAWAAVAIPGAEVLRNALADLSASEHRDWTPHCTLAYLDPGEPLPAPLEPVPVTFGCLSVHRGGEVVRFPFGPGSPDDSAVVEPVEPVQGDEDTCPCGTPVVYDEMDGWQHADGSVSHDDGESVSDKMATIAKAGEPRPKVRKATAPAWPGWDLDIPAADYWGEKVASALSAALTKAEAKRLASAWLASPESRVQHDGKRPAVAAAAAWFEMNGPDLKAALEPLMTGLLTDAMAIGALSAQAVTGGAPVAKARPKGGLNPAAAWKPGNTLMSGGMLGSAGIEGPDSGDAADAADQLAASTRTAAGRALAEGGQADDSAAATGGNLFAAVTNAAAAAAAVMSLITAGVAAAASHWYLKLAVQWTEWQTDGASACAVCQANEAAGPVRLGESFPGGVTSPPQHPHCRCQALPAGWVNPPPGTGEPEPEDEAGEAGEAGEEDEGGPGTGDLEDSGDEEPEGEEPGDEDGNGEPESPGDLGYRPGAGEAPEPEPPVTAGPGEQYAGDETGAGDLGGGKLDDEGEEAGGAGDSGPDGGEPGEPEGGGSGEDSGEEAGGAGADPVAEANALGDAYENGYEAGERMSGGMGGVQRITLSDGTEAVLKTHEEASQALHEYLSGLVGRALGIEGTGTALAGEDVTVSRLVPGDIAAGFIDQAYTDALKGGGTDYEQAEADAKAEEVRQLQLGNGREIGLLDYLTSNIDRNWGNWLVDGDTVYPIDQALSEFAAQDAGSAGAEMLSPFSRYWLSAGQDAAGSENIAVADLRNPFSSAEMDGFRSALEQLRPEFGAKGASSEYGYMMDRLSLLESAS